MQTRFEWDAEKAKTNLIKHRVSFETAAQVFADPFAMVEQDRIEDGTEVIRVISARRAEPKERKRYEQNCAL
jgi:uncharacterized DUF497 family protein